MTTPKIAIIIGSTRPGRSADTVARWVYDVATDRDDATFEVLDLIDFDLPMLDEPMPPMSGEVTHEHTHVWGAVIGAFALTEPDSGSDAGALRTAAVAEGDGWRITGSKQWITNGSHAGTLLLFARTDPATEGPRGVSAFLLDGDQVEVTREEEKLGLHSSSTADVRIEGAYVGRERLLHEERKGFTVAMHALDGGRIGIAAQAVGIAQAAFDAARGYALERRQFGTRIADFQAIQFKLADMSMEIDAARWLTYRAAWLKQHGHPHTAEGAKAKLLASRTAVRVTQEAIQVLGGYGYTREFPVERYYRDAKITEIYEGTSEIQRLVIARHILAQHEGRVAPTVV